MKELIVIKPFHVSIPYLCTTYANRKLLIFRRFRGVQKWKIDMKGVNISVLLFTLSFQKQRSRCVLRKRCSKNTQSALRHGCSPVNSMHIFKTPFPQNTSGASELFFLMNHFILFAYKICLRLCFKEIICTLNNKLFLDVSISIINCELQLLRFFGKEVF